MADAAAASEHFLFFAKVLARERERKKSGAPRDRWNIYIEKSKMNKKKQKNKKDNAYRPIYIF